MTAEAFPPAPRRTWFTNLAGAAAILAGGAGSLFSAFALLMAIGKPYANSTVDPLGIFLIFIVPPATLLAGIGLLFRRRWARWWLILFAVGVTGLGVKGLLATASESPAWGTVDERPAGAARWVGWVPSLVAVAAGGLLLTGLCSRPVRREFGAAG